MTFSLLKSFIIFGVPGCFDKANARVDVMEMKRDDSCKVISVFYEIYVTSGKHCSV